MANVDDFTGADGENLGGRTASGGWTWTHVDGNADFFEINASNQLKIGAGHGADSSFKAPSAGTADHYAQFRIRSVVDALWGFGCVRLTDKNNWIGFRYQNNSNVTQLLKRVSGTITVIANGGFASIGDVFRISASGNTITCTQNGGSPGFAAQTISDHNTVQTPGLLGFGPGSGGNDPQIDDWESTAAAAAASASTRVYGGGCFGRVIGG